MNLSSRGPLFHFRLARRSGAGLAAAFLTLTLGFAASAQAQGNPDPDTADQAAPKKPVKTTRNAQGVAAPRVSMKSALKGKKETEGSDFLRRRADWFFQPRAFPIGFIPQGARERALQQMRQMYQREGRIGFLAPSAVSGFVAPPLGPTSAWTSIGPQPTNSSSNPPFTSGRVTALAVNPNNSNNAYLGGADGGLWVTTDGGMTWTPLTDNPANSGIPTVAVGAVAVDQTTCTAVGICTTVYVGTGEDNFAFDNIYGEGVLKCSLTPGPPPSAVCTQDSTFHFSNNLPLTNVRGGPLVGALAVNRAAGKNNILLAGVRGLVGTPIPSGIWCSADSGTTWTRVLPTSATASTVGTDVAFASDGTAWVALGTPFLPGDPANNGIYKSSAPVISCSSIMFAKQTLPAGMSTNIGRITLALAPTSDTTIYAAIADLSTDSINLLGVARSTNANMTTPAWMQLTDPLVGSTQGFCNGQCWFDMPLSVEPQNPAIVYAGGAGAHPIIRTINGTTSASWVDVAGNGGSFPHVDTHAFAFTGDGSKLFVGNDGGVWSTNTPGSTIFWNNLNGPASSSTGALNITQFYPGVSIHPSNPGFALGGTQDNGVQIDQAVTAPPATSLTWQDGGIPCDGGFTAIDFTVPSTSYGECEYVPNPNGLLLIAVTFAGDGVLGNGFVATSGIDGADRGSFIPPLVMDPNNSNTLYFGTCRVYKTTNNALTWAAISPDVTTPTRPAGCPEPFASGQPSGVLKTIAAAPGNSNIVYVGSNQGEVEVTSDAGASWTSIVTPTLPTRAVTQIAVDSTNPATAYVTFSGFGTCANSTITCDAKGHVFRTTNGTAGTATIWTDISGTTPGSNLPDIPVNAIVIDPDDPTHNTLYVGTDIGAFVTSNAGVSWSPLGASASMPNAEILSLTLHDPSRTLRAGTHGRGVWDLNLGPLAGTANFRVSAISPLVTTAPGAAFTLTVKGSGFTSTSTVLWGGSARTTDATNAAAGILTASITAADVAAGAVIQVSVKDTAGTTNSLPFVVLGAAPTLTACSSSLPASGGPACSTPVQTPTPSTNVSLTLTGTNFSTTSQVTFNGSTTGVTVAAPTASCPVPTCLQATLDKSLLGPFGSTNDINVANQPGNQFSAAQTFTVVAPPPPNDNFANAINIPSNTFTDTKDSSGATTETADPVPPAACVPQLIGNTGGHPNGAYNTIWYKFTPTTGGSLEVDTIGSNYDTVLSIWTGSGSTEATLTATSVACNDDINPGIIIQSQLKSINLAANTTYFFMVSSFGPPDPNPVALGGKSVLNFTFTPPPFTLTPQAPTSVMVTAGNPASYTVAVASTGSFTGTVNLSCTLPAAATACTVNPPSVTLGASQNVTVTVTTTRRGALPPSVPIRQRPFGRTVPLMFIAMLALLVALLAARTRRQRLALSLPLAALVLLFVFQAAGCGGGGGGGGGGTPAGMYTVTITGVSGTTSSIANVTLVVN